MASHFLLATSQAIQLPLLALVHLDFCSSFLPTTLLCPPASYASVVGNFSHHIQLTQEAFLSVLHLALDVLPSTWKILSHLPKFRFICFPFQTLSLARKQLTPNPCYEPFASFYAELTRLFVVYLFICLLSNQTSESLDARIEAFSTLFPLTG